MADESKIQVDIPSATQAVGKMKALSDDLPNYEVPQKRRKSREKTKNENSPKPPPIDENKESADGLNEQTLLQFANEQKLKKGDDGLPEKQKHSDDRRSIRSHSDSDYSSDSPEEEPRQEYLTGEQIKEKAELLSKLERKARLTKAKINIPENATLNDLTLMYNKLCYDHRSALTVNMLRNFYVGLNTVGEHIANAHPSWGLDLEQWSEQVKAIVTNGDLDDIFYEIFDEYKEYFRVGGLYTLCFHWFSSLLMYSSTQKMLKEMQLEKVRRGEREELKEPSSEDVELLKTLRKKAQEEKKKEKEVQVTKEKEQKKSSKATLDAST